MDVVDEPFEVVVGLCHTKGVRCVLLVAGVYIRPHIQLHNNIYTIIIKKWVVSRGVYYPKCTQKKRIHVVCPCQTT